MSAQPAASVRRSRFAVFALVGLSVATAAAIASDPVPATLVIAGASLTGLLAVRAAPRVTRAQYERNHRPLAGPRPGARLG